jgi:hypothetical protein
VGLGRFELPTSPLSGVRSNQLSYRPARRKPGHTRPGIEPSGTPWRGKRCTGGGMRPRPRSLGYKVSRSRLPKERSTGILRKEVIQPQVPLRLPCYDFTPVADLTVDGCLRS